MTGRSQATGSAWAWILPLALRILGCVSLAALPAGGAALAFGGEDVLDGSPWHHADMTLRAAADPRAAFSADAAESLAWHADYIDSYLYNPIWWFDAGGGYDRLQAALAIRDDLIELHFDDLFSTAALELAWQRYLTGTLAGLLWAAEKHGAGDASAIPIAHNLIGVSLHAVQDFYAHSTWLDHAELRGYTWFEVAPGQLGGVALSSGAYELGEHLGEHSHGIYAPSCTLLSALVVPEVLTVACQAISPFSNGGVCQQFKACQQGVSVGISARDWELPENVAYLAPPGIALDNTWLARIASGERGLVQDGALLDERGFLSCQADCQRAIWDAGSTPRTCLASDFVFATAKLRATETSVQWLEALGAAMRDAGHEAFWEAVRAADVPVEQRTRVYESLVHAPFQFLSAGAYPLDGTESGDGTYLRLRLRTGDEAFAGTNGDIVLTTHGELPASPEPRAIAVPAAGSNPLGEPGAVAGFLLDYMPYDQVLLNVNDFERGSDRVYTVGPFDAPPTRLTLHNAGGDAADVAATVAGRVAAAVSEGLTTARRTVIGLIAGNADRIGQGHYVFRPEELQAVPPGRSLERTIRIHDDFGEGTYDVVVHLYKFASSPTAEGADRYQVRIVRLDVEREGTFDRGTDSDEPFVLAVLNPLPGERQAQLLGPFDDVDTGESVGIPAGAQDFRVFDVDARRGMISLAVMLMESDDETSGDREEALQRFAGDIDESLEDAERGVVDAISAGVGSDWLLDGVEVTSFRRGTLACARTILSARPRAWIEGGGAYRIDLPDADPCRDASIAYADVRPASACAKAAVRTGEELARCMERGGVIELAAGTYVLPRTVTVRRDLEILGAGAAATVVASSGGGPLVRFEGCGHFRAEHVAFRGDADASAGLVELHDGATRLSFCSVEGTRSAAVASDPAVIAGRAASGVVVRGSETRFIGRDIDVHGHAGHGVVAMEGAAVAVRDGRIAANGASGLAAFDDSAATLEEVIVRDNAQHGVAAAEGASRVDLFGVRLQDNAMAGLALFSGSTARMQDGYATGNGQAGVAVLGAAGLRMHGGAIETNREAGLRVNTRGGVLVEDAAIRGNAFAGVVLEASDAAVLQRNRIEGNGQDGIVFLRSTAATVAGNAVTGNAGYAYYTASERIALDVEGNTLAPNDLGVTNPW